MANKVSMSKIGKVMVGAVSFSGSAYDKILDSRKATESAGLSWMSLQMSWMKAFRGMPATLIWNLWFWYC